MIHLDVGRVLRFLDEDRCERLLWRPEVADGFFCIEIHDGYAAPIFRRRVELEDLIADGALAEADDPWAHPMAESSLTAAQKAKRDQHWALIQPLVLEQPRSFDAKYRARLIQNLVPDTGISQKTLARLIRRYWQRGMTPNALLPDYANSGAPGQSRASGAAKRGRPAVIGLPGMNIDAQVRQQIKDTVTRVFARNHKLDVSEAYQRLLETYFMDTAVDPVTGRQHLHLRAPHPTLGQFRYWLEKDNDTFALERRRRTPRVYDKDMRGVLGTSTSEVTGPGSRWQIDATIADVYLVSRMDRRRIVGRPTLYFVMTCSAG